MATITEEARENLTGPRARQALGQLQAKIDADLLDRADQLAARRSIQERRKVFRRDVIEDALRDHLPRAERALEKASKRT
jgi:hypothetical protein